MKKMFKIMAILTGFFTIIVLNFSALQAGLIEPTQSLKATAEDPGQIGWEIRRTDADAN